MVGLACRRRDALVMNGLGHVTDIWRAGRDIGDPHANQRGDEAEGVTEAP
jgi:hypothetical protein